MSGVAVVLDDPDPLPHLGPRHTVGVQQVVEVSNDQTLDVKGAANPPSLDTLDCSGHSAQDPHLVATKLKFSEIVKDGT